MLLLGNDHVKPLQECMVCSGWASMVVVNACSAGGGVGGSQGGRERGSSS